MKGQVLKKLANEKFILKIIRYSPPIFILLVAILIILYISFNYKDSLNKEKLIIKKNYIELNTHIIKRDIDTITNYIKKKNNTENEVLKKETKEQVYFAYDLMTSIYNEFKDTKTKEEITQIIKVALKDIKFNNGRGYYFIFDMKGTGIFHATTPKEREGVNLFNIQDSRGTYIVQESINIAKSKKAEGYQTWFFPKYAGSLQEDKKLGFIKAFKPYDWYIGVGEVIEDFQKKVKKEILEHIQDIEYENNRYVFLFDKKNNILISKNKLIKNMNIDDLKLRPLSIYEQLKEFNNSEKESIYIEYKIKDKNIFDSKISYLKKIHSYDWIIGTGFNYDNLNLIIDQKQKELDLSHEENLNVIKISTLVITIILLLLSFLLSKFIEKIFLNYKRKLLENEAMKFEAMMEELNIIFDNLPMNVIYKDTKDNIIRGNKTLANKLGLSIEEVRNVPTKKLFPHFYKRYYEHDLEIIKSKKVKEGIIEEYYSKEGLRLIEYSNIPIFDKNGEVKNIIVFVTDITEQEALKEDNQRKETLLYQQTKMATMGEMIANIAHQWKQPLSTITVAATGTKLQKELNSLSDESLIYALESINNSAQYLSQTIDDFRNFFNPNSNNFLEFKISSPINKTLKLLLPKFKVQNIEVIQDIEDVEIISLENEIIQVLINILNNARDELIKYKHRKLIFIKTYKEEDSLIIEIKDNARGINEDIIEKIFDPYFTTKESNDGTGIGLYMSKNILTKLLNANITVENETFTYEKVEYSGAKFIIRIKAYQ